MNVSIFCGSQSKAGDSYYNEAYQLGKMLAESGHTILSGGYIGTMEAVSRGAAEAGGNVVGVTCDEIETWRPVKPNQWINEEHRFQTLIERLVELMQACDAAIALPGGPGTLTEIALTWNLMIVRSMTVKPLVLIGTGWQAVINTFFCSFDSFITQSQRDLILFADDNQEALKIINGVMH